MTEPQARVLYREPTGQVKLVEYERRFFDVSEAHFGRRFRNYRRDWTAASRYEALPDFPLSLDLEINSSCNQKCIMCVRGGPNRDRYHAGRPKMDPDLYEKLMVEAEKHSLPAMTFGFLSEPLLHDDLPRMIARAREAGVMDIRLGTNGILLTRGTAEELIRAGLTRLEVSLDAFRPETYRRIRKGGSLTEATRRVLDFLEARDRAGSDFPILRLSFLRLPANRDELDDFMGFWRDKADLFSIQEPIYFEDAPISTDTDLVLPLKSPENFHCAQPWQRLVVRADGSALPCCSIYGLKMPLGRLDRASVPEVWNGPTLDRLRRMQRGGRSLDHPVCRDCARRHALTAAPGRGVES